MKIFDYLTSPKALHNYKVFGDRLGNIATNVVIDAIAQASITMIKGAIISALTKKADYYIPFKDNHD